MDGRGVDFKRLTERCAGRDHLQLAIEQHQGREGRFDDSERAGGFDVNLGIIGDGLVLRTKGSRSVSHDSVAT